jgi:hypothetical protein
MPLCQPKLTPSETKKARTHWWFCQLHEPNSKLTLVAVIARKGEQRDGTLAFD